MKSPQRVCIAARGRALFSSLPVPHAADMPDPNPLRTRSARQDVPLRNRAFLVAALALVNSALYIGSNAYPLREPIMMPHNTLDLTLGWHAWTIWPYWLLLVLAPVLALQIRQARLLHATLRAYAVALLTNVAIWLAWPTKIVRHAIADTLDPATAAAWRLLYMLDGTGNCFPSGHVTIPLVIATGLCAQYPQARRWVWIAIAILLPSVVTTGQHSSWDVLGGAATAAFGIRVASPDLLRTLR